jgi:hypothetical protein
MLGRQLLAYAAVTSFLWPALACGDEVRYYADNGITYCETRRTVQRPVYQTQMQQSTRTVCRPQPTTELRPMVCTRWVPVTEYRCESHWVGRWNPLVEPYLATTYVPCTRWQSCTEVVQVPVTCTRLVPETQNVQVPVTVCRTLPEEVVTRVPVRANPWAVAPAASPGATWPGSGPIGGVARLDKDPPRYGTGSAWRASTTR